MDLTNAFFSIAIVSDRQDQFAFTWQQQHTFQYTFQVLPQGWNHSPSVCHQMVAADLALQAGAITVCHYIDEPLIMAESQQEIEAAVELLIAQ